MLHTDIPVSSTDILRTDKLFQDISSQEEEGLTFEHGQLTTPQPKHTGAPLGTLSPSSGFTMEFWSIQAPLLRLRGCDRTIWCRMRLHVVPVVRDTPRLRTSPRAVSSARAYGAPLTPTRLRWLSRGRWRRRDTPEGGYAGG